VRLAVSYRMKNYLISFFAEVIIASMQHIMRLLSPTRESFVNNLQFDACSCVHSLTAFLSFNCVLPLCGLGVEVESVNS
jgi:hypothetical protein